MKHVALLVAATLLMTGCAGDTAPDETPTFTSTPTPTPTTAAFWADLPDSLQTLIDEDAANGDCDNLQATFDTWAEVDDVQADLLTYIDNAMREADCY